jgi:hypothetical protein
MLLRSQLQQPDVVRWSEDDHIAISGNNKVIVFNLTRTMGCPGMIDHAVNRLGQQYVINLNDGSNELGDTGPLKASTYMAGNSFRAKLLGLPANDLYAETFSNTRSIRSCMWKVLIFFFFLCVPTGQKNLASISALRRDCVWQGGLRKVGTG